MAILYLHQWRRDGKDIPNQTDNTYTPTSVDVGHLISCAVTATNSAGTSLAISNEVVSFLLPENTALPVVSGGHLVGDELSCTTGTWANQVDSYAYQWLREGGAIPGATHPTYTVAAADAAFDISCAVHGVNAGGPSEQPAISNAIAIDQISTWSAADAALTGMTLSDGNLTVTPTGSSALWQVIRGTTSKEGGKVYVEFLMPDSHLAGYITWGLASSGIDVNVNLGSSNYSGGMWLGQWNYCSAGFTTHFAGMDAVSTPSWYNNVVALAIDFTHQNIWVAMNNVWLDGGDPAANVLPALSFNAAMVGPLYPAASFDGGLAPLVLLAYAGGQKFAPPSGFVAWDT